MFHMIYSAKCYLFKQNSMDLHTVCSVHLLVLIVCKLTPWSTVTLEMLTGPQPVKTVPAFYGTQRSFTVFATAHRLYPQWFQWTQSMPSPPMPRISTLTLHTHLHLGLPSSPTPSGFPTRTPCIFLPWYAYYIQSFWTWSPKKYLVRSTNYETAHLHFYPSLCYFFPLRPTYLPLHPVVKIFQPMSFV